MAAQLGELLHVAVALRLDGHEPAVDARDFSLFLVHLRPAVVKLELQSLVLILNAV